MIFSGLFEHEIEKIAISFSENEGGGGKGRLELFLKFISFGAPTRP